MTGSPLQSLGTDPEAWGHPKG